MALTLELLATLAAALFAGGALYVSVVEHPARMKTGAKAALTEFRPSYRRAAPWQAACAAVSLFSGVVVAFLTSALAWAIGGLLVGAAIPFTLVVIMPINRRLLDTNATLSDNDAAALLDRWGRLHALRSILGTAGLLIFLSKALLR
jgi:uncharacterized membrane protein